MNSNINEMPLVTLVSLVIGALVIGVLVFIPKALAAGAISVGTTEFGNLGSAINDFCINPDKSVKVEVNIPPPLHYEYQPTSAGYGKYETLVLQQGCRDRCLCLTSAEDQKTPSWWQIVGEVTAENRIPQSCLSLVKSPGEYCKNADLKFKYGVKAVRIGKIVPLPLGIGSAWEKKGQTVDVDWAEPNIYPSNRLAKRAYLGVTEYVYEAKVPTAAVLSIQKDTSSNGIEIEVVSEA